MNWTADQQRVIDTRGSNILVAAAAGSGKTAVLVARIMSLITDLENPADIDDLLIVTFTRAAAGEMRERIAKALSERLETEPDNEHLQRQLTLIHNAQITTIDGFCSWVVRNYAQTVGLAPGFRVAEEGEIALLQRDVLSEVIESRFAEEDKEIRAQFEAFVETFATGKSEKAMEDAILRVYNAAESNESPEKWLQRCREENRELDEDSLGGLGWVKEMEKDADDLIDTCIRLAEENVASAIDGRTPQYLKSAEGDLENFRMLKDTRSYRERFSFLRSYKKPRIENVKKTIATKEHARFKFRREEEDSIIKELNEIFYPLPLEAVIQYQNESSAPLRVLIDVTEQFMERLAQEKRDKNLMDFSDLEHFALKVLRDDAGNRTYVAKELAARFKEVMIDEYQDSNFLQEAILTAVSRIEDGSPNYFCVGDVKQSIYSFRQARPDLFIDKFRTFREDPSKGTRIDLHQNFRSRHEVLDSVNCIFEQIMRPEIGGVDYDEDAALVPGADYPEEDGFKTEIIPVFTSEEDSEGGQVVDAGKSQTKKELEARAIAQRIKRMVGNETIYDPKAGAFRKVRFRDIVILLRTMDGWADVYAKTLAEFGIRAYSTAKSGYFTALEVETVLAYLDILDNPQQDIPFTAVLRSAFAGVTADELAIIRTLPGVTSFSGITDRDAVSMYDCAREYRSAGKNLELKNKLEKFFAFYDRMKEMLPYTALHEVIYSLLTESGYLEYASSLPGGAQRAMNLRMLVDKAVEFEKTSYSGLFNFIRYMGNLKKYSVDFGEQSILSEDEDVVRIYSIHKSKGLEYPIVFLAGTQKRFNTRDTDATLIMHPTMGLAMDYINYKDRFKSPTLKKMAIRRRLQKESVGEELRVLYVALTRAQQKLIVTGTIKDEEALEDLSLTLSKEEKYLPVNYILKGGSYLSWILPAAARRDKISGGEGRYFILDTRNKPSELVMDEIHHQSGKYEMIRKLAGAAEGGVRDPDMAGLLDERFSFVYPYSGRQNLPFEVTVSEIKKAYIEEHEEFPELDNPARLYPDEATQSDEFPVPDFMRPAEASGDEKKELLRGPLRGTAYHRVMELADFIHAEGLAGENLLQFVEADMEAGVESGRLEGIQRDSVAPSDVARFMESSLGQRLARADVKGELFREQPFVLGMKASDIKQEWPEDETVLVQGIIDAFFVEDGEVVLLDYKTDQVTSGQELRDRYKIQIDAYAEAIQKITEYRVKERYLWSFKLGEAISL